MLHHPLQRHVDCNARPAAGPIAAEPVACEQRTTARFEGTEEGGESENESESENKEHRPWGPETTDAEEYPGPRRCRGNQHAEAEEKGFVVASPEGLEEGPVW